MNNILILRGRVYVAKDYAGEHHYLVISNNPRNGRLPDVLAVALTAEPLPVTPTVVMVPKGEPFVGRALCDRIDRVLANEFVRDLGPLSRTIMRQVNDGLRAAMGLH
jgi:mRNA-degrading endonuclease toxin of MazEF toxin-antitoxin module